MSLAFTAPHLSPERALGLLARHYALSGTLEPLPSERDQNFRLTTAAGARYVFKIANAQEDRALLEAQQEAMARVAERHGPGPRVIPGAQGATLFECEEDGRRHLCWLVEWLPGHPLAEIGTIPPGLWHELGAGLARLDQALAGGPPSALDRDFCWNLAGAERIVSQALPTIADQELRGAMQTLRAGVRPEFFSLRRQVIHNDANDFNVLIDLPRDTSRQPARLAGFIDFGDLGVGPRVADPAIAVAYAMLGRADPLAVAGEIVAGYHRQSPLADEEFAALFGLACLRLCLSVANAQRQHRENPA
ncbi:MAG TPA: phosphotransferase, partial [Candidatus Aminicenantes bacterium]|nr:phosphotransferase [Candidatus Aminicenantes bacterium]